ncbi:MAG: hypothetical protein ACLUI3_17020 [Christensenellales bacterium]
MHTGKEIDGKRIVYDFDVPEEVESVKQYRTEAVRMKLGGWNKSPSHTFRTAFGDTWDLINDRQWNDTNFATLNRMEDTHVRAAVT